MSLVIIFLMLKEADYNMYILLNMYIPNVTLLSKLSYCKIAMNIQNILAAESSLANRSPVSET